jgi:hypothetical protein
LTLYRNVSLVQVLAKERFVIRERRKFKQILIGSTATLTLALIIAVLTLAPMPSGGPAGSDKIYHILAFASLAFPLSLVRPRLVILVALAVIAYGGSIELVQPFFGRQAEWADLVADTFGAVLGAGAGYVLSGRLLPLSKGCST